MLVIDDSPTFPRHHASLLAESRVQRRPRGEWRGWSSRCGDIRPLAIHGYNMLPGIDGSTVVRRIRFDAALRQYPMPDVDWF